MIQKWIAALLAIGFGLSSTVAQAQNCASIKAERYDADRSGRALVEDNPGTALVAFGCMAAAKSQYDQSQSASDAASTFAVCGGFGCTLTGDTQNCMSAGTRIIYHAIRVTVADDQLERYRCPR
ncbi:hypothetical protein PQ455_03360 [Sphingomonas naphthae]|uniref:DUF4189 domain-containing protein n=1 Tax=Sphingomonas naphthae TaxID=1813468 RepID=A0ABY7TMV0_9SPHN|nr:hypothetical protein [Sphingomonas naphthae]WCT74280.1 hypothetical protein PQ455_03360 [Sphingomonas naphthae]